MRIVKQRREETEHRKPCQVMPMAVDAGTAVL
jgi:hypothetical protein